MVKCSVVDPHHFDEDPDADLDSTYHPDADPDADYHFDADPDADSDPDVFGADPEPDFYFMRIWIRMRIQFTKMMWIWMRIQIHNTVKMYN
jgi:hypothetical protein